MLGRLVISISAVRSEGKRYEAYVSFEGIQKSYDGINLCVKDLNLQLSEGEFLTMLGPSGSGKTTCLMMLAGFEPVTNGDIFLKGKPINNIPPHKRDIGMVFQNYALFPHMSIAENLAFPLQVRRMPKEDIKKEVKAALDMVELSEFGDRRPAQLSGGQQQRVALARALIFQPGLVLMDEPLGALDKQLREQMQYEIKHLHEKLGITIVYVTHDQSEALAMSDRIAVFNDGIIQQVSTPNELYEKPVNSFVAQFIGENNKFDGIVKSMENGICNVEVPGVGIINAVIANVERTGSPTILSLRPERIEFNPEKGTLPNMLEGRIEELIYLGDHIRMRMMVADNENFIVKIPGKIVDNTLRKGSTITIGWETKDCLALDSPDNPVDQEK